MNLLRRWPVAAFATAALSLSLAWPAAAADPPFPRRAIVEYGGQAQEYADADFRASVAAFDLTILTTWPNFGGTTGWPTARVVGDLKDIAERNHHDIKVFLYAKEDNLVNDTGDSWQVFRKKITDNHWYLYTTGTSGSPVASDYGTDYPAINTTRTAAVDYMTQFFKDLGVPRMDGWFMDDMFAQTRVAGDWDVDNHTDAKQDPATSKLLRQGWVHYVNVMRGLAPDLIQIGNVADWATAVPTFGVIDDEYKNGLLDGGLLEGMIGASYSQENQASTQAEPTRGWTRMMQQYRATMAALGDKKMGIFLQDAAPNNINLKDFRYGLASALMDNAYYAYSETGALQYHKVHWFDEYDANLGQATSPPATTPWKSGIFRRDFENGIALVNPKGNGPNNGTTPITVTLEAPYVKLSASSVPGAHHDATVNNGETVTSVTLQPRDGIILLRVSTPGKFGRTTVGTAPSAGMGTNQKRGSKFTLAEAGTVTSFSAYLDGNGGASGSEDVRIVLYRDANGTPGVKLAESNVVTINSGAAGAWVTFPATQATFVTAGSYWLVIHTGGTAGIARNMGDGTTDPNWYSNADTFSDGPSDPFGTGNAGTGTISIYASYTPGTPKQFGMTTPGTKPSNGMSGDFKRASKYTLSETGTLVSLAAYLDGNGGTAGSQSVRLALYQDVNGAPGTRVAESNVVNIAAGTAPGWVTFTTPPTSLAAGSYWIAIHTGGTAGVARDYTDGSGVQNWFSNADTFSDGSATPFGAGNLGADNLSVYVNYLH
jgi:hypothetical protein